MPEKPPQGTKGIGGPIPACPKCGYEPPSRSLLDRIRGKRPLIVKGDGRLHNVFISSKDRAELIEAMKKPERGRIVELQLGTPGPIVELPTLSAQRMERLILMGLSPEEAAGFYPEYYGTPYRPRLARARRNLLFFDVIFWGILIFAAGVIALFIQRATS